MYLSEYKIYLMNYIKKYQTMEGISRKDSGNTSFFLG